MMKYIKVFLAVTIIVLTFSSCFRPKEKGTKLYPSLAIDSYDVIYEGNAIKIVPNYNGTAPKHDTCWNMFGRQGEFRLTYQGKNYVFMSSKRELDTIYQKGLELPVRILIKKINDSLFVSAFDKIVVNEATLLEVVYDKNYEIKQVRYQTMWMDYVPPKGKMLDYVPLLYQYSRENVAGNNESVGCIAP